MNALAAVVPTSGTVTAILDRLSGRLSGARLKEARTFAEGFLAGLSDEDLVERDADTWSHLITDLFEFARTRPAGTAMVRVFNPTAAEHGWDGVHTVIQIANDDMPFLVDSVSMVVHGFSVRTHALIHPVYGFNRDPGGHLLAIGEPGKSGCKGESIIHMEIDRRVEAEEIRAIREAIERALRDVRASVHDWRTMRDRMIEVADLATADNSRLPADELAETRDFLRWVAGDHFTFIGYREYEVATVDGEEVLRAVPGTGLGILRDDSAHPSCRSLKSLHADSNGEDAAGSGPVIITKTNARATVHRPGHMDYIGVLQFDGNGAAVREHRFIGLFTSGAYMRRPGDVPLVRTKVDQVMKRSGLSGDSHKGKALKHVLETLPRDELFQCSVDELSAMATGIVSLQERNRTRLFLRRGRFGRFWSALVFIPRDRFNTTVRERIESLLYKAFDAEAMDTQIQVSESSLARLHLVIRPRAGNSGEVDVAALETQVKRIVRNWHDELRDVLVERNGADTGLRLVNRYARGLPSAYIEDNTPDVAAADIEAIDQLSIESDLRLNLYQPDPDDDKHFRFKLYRLGEQITLSEALPMMENMGLRIQSEHPYTLEIAGSRISVQDFEITFSDENIDVDVQAAHVFFEEAFEAVWRGKAENDSFNRLIVAARLFWREVAVLRAYTKYLLQVGVPFSQAYFEQTVNAYPVLARLMVEVFQAKFEPTRAGESAEEIEREQNVLRRALTRMSRNHADREQIEALAVARGQGSAAFEKAVVEAFKTLLEQVSSLDEDRILRSLMAALHATLRTNFYQVGPDGKPHPYFSFKIDPSRLIEAPRPKPHREVFVYSPRVEGVHLRFGPVARGGLRWSDRREDFRTEVLGLVKAQMVKNTVIVPVGAKGGFFVKRPPVGGDRDAVLAEGVSCYRTFINGLLDITDNLIDGRNVAPENVVRHDGDDSYMVVAADKGTATFSDIANAVAAEHDFWLGDAFASGGSYGYDHKGMGITARGAWESVKRHFRALGVDCQKEDFTAVGIGDMSGDVFGNGMLLSKHIRLVAAFDHRHIFVDPDPDAARSYKERERMFALPRSSWDDYDRKLISAGGGIWPRSAKTIPVSAEMRAALGIEESTGSMTPVELMRAILKAPVDLLWNGGIGTYVKAASETHAEVGDRATIALRIDGNELRCKVVGEGGNLGMTQRGRIEAARQAGVLLNTDFIDNSAGVDTSDHEVNIKILLNGLVAAGKLDFEARNQLLVEMTDEVAELVLNDNYRQNQAISVMERLCRSRMGSKQHLIRVLESQGKLDRSLEFLPSDAEFDERMSRGEILTRPELSVLLSYAKMELFQQLLDTDVPEDPHLSTELERYFPQPIRDRFGAELEEHRLRREIIATAVTNSIINRMGSTFVLRMQEDTGKGPGEIAKAYSIARETLNARALWAAIDALDGKVTDAVQVDALTRIWTLLRSMTRWLLTRHADLGIAQAVQRYAPGLGELRGTLAKVVSAPVRETMTAEAAQWREAGLPKALADDIAGLGPLASALDIVDVANQNQLTVPQAAEVYFQLGEALNLSWLMARIEELQVAGRWHAQARGELREELFGQHRTLTAQVLASGKGENVSARKLVQQWQANAGKELAPTLALFADLRSQVNLDFATVMVAVRTLARLVDGSASR